MAQRGRPKGNGFLGREGATVASDLRVRLPVNLLRQLLEQRVKNIVLAKLLGAKALVMCPAKVWPGWIRDKTKALEYLRTDEGKRAFIAPSESVCIDRKGRITIPDHLADYANIKEGSKLLIHSMGSYFEIWNQSDLNDEVARLEKVLSGQEHCSKSSQ